jgi:uncharacterized membrane protein YphA (DoxX/SURF4 family)
MTHFTQFITEIFLLLFLLITYLQSGMDKILDWQGNVGWLKEHFAKTPFKNSVPLLLSTILITEMIAGILCAIGVFQLGFSGRKTIAFYAAFLSCIILLMLLFGQRMAKDYEGAKTIAVYFIPSIFLLYLLNL